MSLAFLYTKYKKNIQSIKTLFDFCFDNNIIVLKNNYVNFVLNKIFSKVFVSNLINLQQKRNMPKKDLLVYLKTGVLKDLTSYKIILEKKLNVIITKIRLWL
jgi:hypothetical protein